ncbi:MAG: nuclear transport factor 2 family protein [Proteobacteria bacterium]|nr:MAG: nuclear transport factor 2 family protein [Pseudomonadota bacterium]
MQTQSNADRRPALAPESDRVKQAEQFFKNLSAETLHLVDEFYDPAVQFVDPIHELQGSSAVKAYYKKLYENADRVEFSFSESIEQKDSVLLVWTMTLQTKALNGGKPYSVDGNSLLHFGGGQGKVVYHRDYFDLGAFVYERLPILRSIITVIKKQMSKR